MGSITRHANKCFVLFLVDIKLGYYIIRIPCVYVWCGKGRGCGWGRGRTDAILILLYGDQTKGLSFNWTISTDHLSLRARLGQCYVQLHNKLFLLLLYFLGGGGLGGRTN